MCVHRRASVRADRKPSSTIMPVSRSSARKKNRTGIRSCTLLTKSLASVIIMVQDFSGSPVSMSFPSSHMRSRQSAEHPIFRIN
jgi:hypothetical protein